MQSRFVIVVSKYLSHYHISPRLPLITLPLTPTHWSPWGISRKHYCTDYANLNAKALDCNIDLIMSTSHCHFLLTSSGLLYYYHSNRYMYNTHTEPVTNRILLVTNRASEFRRRNPKTSLRQDILVSLTVGPATGYKPELLFYP
jgi:hypothetical protein